MGTPPTWDEVITVAAERYGIALSCDQMARCRSAVEQADGREAQLTAIRNFLSDMVVEVLKGALAFYADPKNWVTPSTGFAVQYDPEPPPVQRDRGARAREALKVGPR